MGREARTGSEKWLFNRRASLPWIASFGFLFGGLATATPVAGEIWPQSYFAVIELSNVMILFLLPGMAAAMGTFGLMAVYLARYDPRPHGERRRWIKWFIIGGTFTACIYCLTVYRGQMQEWGRGVMPRSPWREAEGGGSENAHGR